MPSPPAPLLEQQPSPSWPASCRPCSFASRSPATRSRQISTRGCKSGFTVPWRVRISSALRRRIARTIESDAAKREASSQIGQVECSSLHGNGFGKTRLFTYHTAYPSLLSLLMDSPRFPATQTLRPVGPGQDFRRFDRRSACARSAQKFCQNLLTPARSAATIQRTTLSRAVQATV